MRASDHKGCLQGGALNRPQPHTACPALIPWYPLDIPVTVIADGVSSYTTFQRTTALGQLSSLQGVQVSSAESVAFEMLGGADPPAFKPVQGCVKDYRAFCSASPHALM